MSENDDGGARRHISLPGPTGPCAPTSSCSPAAAAARGWGALASTFVLSIIGPRRLRTNVHSRPRMAILDIHAYGILHTLCYHAAAMVQLVVENHGTTRRGLNRHKAFGYECRSPATEAFVQVELDCQEAFTASILVCTIGVVSRVVHARQILQEAAPLVEAEQAPARARWILCRQQGREPSSHRSRNLRRIDEAAQGIPSERVEAARASEAIPL
mmetsp:Transcript_68463/g.222780  ORF Transcript_68463/g.222780 Transcript_68463/m.222780 type:complete len:215 (+) Transcript_68463:55-699(+)